MPQPKVTMSVRQAGNGVSVIDIEGEVTGHAENVLADAFVQAAVKARAVVLNFSALEYMNSSGIGLLVTLLIRAQRNHVQLIAYGLSEHYQQIFELTRLNEAIQLYDTEKDVLEALKSHPDPVKRDEK